MSHGAPLKTQRHQPIRSSNAADFFVDRHIREGNGDRPVFIDECRILTYVELAEASSGFAIGLRQAGILPGMRVALLMLDTIAFPIAFWGALRAGVVAVPINTMLPAPQIRYVLDNCGAEAVIVSHTLLPILTDALECAAGPALVVVAGEDALQDGGLEAPALDRSCVGFASFIAGRDEFVVPAEVAPHDLAFLLYTSGSTGQPKGVRHVHASLQATAECFGAHILRITASDRVFSVPKLFFAYGLGNSMTHPMSVGASVVLSPRRATPDHVLSVIRRHEPSVFFGVPTLYAKLIEHAALGVGAGSGKLRCCVSAGEPLPEALGRAWASVTGVDLLDGVGTTEMLHTFLSIRPGDARYPGSGFAVPGYDLRLVDEFGETVDGEGEGELFVRGPSMADGYWNLPDKSALAFRHGWLRTGDRYTRDSTGLYRFVGRTDDMLKVNGIWVSPFEVECTLRLHGGVLAAAVVASRDKDGMVKPRAFVVLRPGWEATDELVGELQAFVRERAGGWKYPRWIEFVNELPETPTGKIQRYKLRQRDCEPALP